MALDAGPDVARNPDELQLPGGVVDAVDPGLGRQGVLVGQGLGGFLRDWDGRRFGELLEGGDDEGARCAAAQREAAEGGGEGGEGAGGKEWGGKAEGSSSSSGVDKAALGRRRRLWSQMLARAWPGQREKQPTRVCVGPGSGRPFARTEPGSIDDAGNQTNSCLRELVRANLIQATKHTLIFPLVLCLQG